MKRILSGLFVALFASVATAGAIRVEVELDPVGSFRAESDKLMGEVHRCGDTFETTDLRLRLDTLKTGLELRDRHLHEKYLEVKKYPEAQMRNVQGKDGKFEADLTFRGRSRRVSGVYHIDGSRMIAVFDFLYQDFGIQPAGYMGVKVMDVVRAEVELPVLSKR